jgi:hypothetical protein
VKDRFEPVLPYLESHHVEPCPKGNDDSLSLDIKNARPDAIAQRQSGSSLKNSF